MKNQIIELNGFKYRVYNVTDSAIHAIKQNLKGDLTINKSNMLTLTNSQIQLICKLKKMENAIGE